jgi:hypothetical protein
VTERKPVDPRRADAIAEAMLQQPRARQAERAKRSGPLLRWRRLIACWLLGFVAGWLFGALVLDDTFVSSVTGVVIGGVIAICLDLRHYRRASTR